MNQLIREEAHLYAKAMWFLVLGETVTLNEHVFIYNSEHVLCIEKKMRRGYAKDWDNGTTTPVTYLVPVAPTLLAKCVQVASTEEKFTLNSNYALNKTKESKAPKRGKMKPNKHNQKKEENYGD